MFKLLVFFLIASVNSHQADPLLVTLPNGQIRGHELKSQNNSVYYAFQEIPYASPPVGNLRYQNPIDPENWEGVLDATQNTKICYQGNIGMMSDLTQTEDCLYLNVYTPVKPGEDTDLLPVLFWIHGGGFEGGAGTFQSVNPAYFMDYDIVIVSINYRLGPFGFLSTNDGVIPGNLGLRDQIFAMKWAKENIELFGGDPEKITIAGQSAGASCVGHHIISKQSSGLFRGAIQESLTPLSTATFQHYPRHYAFKMGTALDSSFSTDNTSEELLQLLQSVSASDIVNANVTVTEGMEVGINDGEYLIWTPSMEDAEDGVIVGPMEDNLEKEDINKVPALVGYNSEEVLFQITDKEATQSLASYFDEDLSRLIGHKFNMTAENKLEAGTELRKLYTDGSFSDDLAAFIHFLSEHKFSAPVTRQADLQSSYTNVYLYQFSYKSSSSHQDNVIDGLDGVAHGEEMEYIWASDMNDFDSMSDSDKLTHYRLLKLWTNFVKYLNPTPEEDELLGNVIWPSVLPSRTLYLNISGTLDVKQDPKHYKEIVSIIEEYVIPPLTTF